MGKLLGADCWRKILKNVVDLKYHFAVSRKTHKTKNGEAQYCHCHLSKTQREKKKKLANQRTCPGVPGALQGRSSAARNGMTRGVVAQNRYLRRESEKALY